MSDGDGDDALNPNCAIHRRNTVWLLRVALRVVQPQLSGDRAGAKPAVGDPIDGLPLE